MHRSPVLIVDHESTAHDVITAALGDYANIFRAHSIMEAEELLQAHSINVLVCRDDLPGETGIMFLARYREIPPWQRRILLCPKLDSDLAVFLINEAQVFRCVTLPIEPAELVQSVEVALHEAVNIKKLFHADKENEKLREQLSNPPYAVSSAQRFASGWVRAFPRMIVVTLLTFVGVLVLGTVTLFLLYLLKTVLGIDLIPGAHLSDALG